MPYHPEVLGKAQFRSKRREKDNQDSVVKLIQVGKLWTRVIRLDKLGNVRRMGNYGSAETLCLGFGVVPCHHGNRLCIAKKAGTR
jgi:hypothetical protein